MSAVRCCTSSSRGLNVLLLDGLHLHEVHARAAGCLDDRLCIVVIVLVCLDEGLDVMRADQLDFDANGLELSCPVMSGTAGLHRDGARL